MRVAAMALMAAFVACGPAEEAEEAHTLSLEDFAGTWEYMATISGVEDPVASTLNGSTDASGWTMSLEGRPDIPLTVRLVGDSLIAETAEYESVLREGVMVVVRTASVLHDDMLMGNLVATYKTPDGDEVVTGSAQGTRAAH